jgi:hypothetical protein
MTVGDGTGTVVPLTAIVPFDGARTPATTSASSRWPFPETPAMPTISPGLCLCEISLFSLQSRLGF